MCAIKERSWTVVQPIKFAIVLNFISLGAQDLVLSILADGRSPW